MVAVRFDFLQWILLGCLAFQGFAHGADEEKESSADRLENAIDCPSLFFSTSGAYCLRIEPSAMNRPTPDGPAGWKALVIDTTNERLVWSADIEEALTGTVSDDGESFAILCRAAENDRADRGSALTVHCVVRAGERRTRSIKGLQVAEQAESDSDELFLLGPRSEGEDARVTVATGSGFSWQIAMSAGDGEVRLADSDHPLRVYVKDSSDRILAASYVSWRLGARTFAEAMKRDPHRNVAVSPIAAALSMATLDAIALKKEPFEQPNAGGGMKVDHDAMVTGLQDAGFFGVCRPGKSFSPVAVDGRIYLPADPGIPPAPGSESRRVRVLAINGAKVLSPTEFWSRQLGCEAVLARTLRDYRSYDQMIPLAVPGQDNVSRPAGGHGAVRCQTVVRLNISREPDAEALADLLSTPAIRVDGSSQVRTAVDRILRGAPRASPKAEDVARDPPSSVLSRLSIDTRLQVALGWVQPFEPDATSTAQFKTSWHDGSGKSVQMMSGNMLAARVLAGDGWRAVRLPLEKGRYWCVFLIADDEQTDHRLGNLLLSENGLTLLLAGQWKAEPVRCELPKLSNWDITHDLCRGTGEGLPRAWQDDFRSRLCPGDPLSLSAARHRVELTLDETGVSFRARDYLDFSALGGEQIRFDRPFFAVVYETGTALPLLLLRVVDPTQGGPTE